MPRLRELLLLGAPNVRAVEGAAVRTGPRRLPIKGGGTCGFRGGPDPWGGLWSPCGRPWSAPGAQGFFRGQDLFLC